MAATRVLTAVNDPGRERAVRQNIEYRLGSLSSSSANPLARATHRPKLHIVDSGLAASLLHVDTEALASPTATTTGRLIESFVAGELARLISSTDQSISLSHYRDRDSREVDLVLDRGDGAVVAIEVKATASPTAGQLRHVAWLRDRIDQAAPGAFRAGLLLHAGTQSFTVGDRLHVRPISTLWSA